MSPTQRQDGSCSQVDRRDTGPRPVRWALAAQLALAITACSGPTQAPGATAPTSRQDPPPVSTSTVSSAGQTCLRVRLSPTAVPAIANVADLALGWRSTCFIDRSELRCLGNAADLADGTARRFKVNGSSTPRTLGRGFDRAFLSPEVAARPCALSGSKLSCWYPHRFVFMGAEPSIREVAGYEETLFVRTADDQLKALRITPGTDRDGEIVLSIADTSYSEVTEKIGKVRQLSAGDGFVCALSSGQVTCLSTWRNTFYVKPLEVTGVADATQISGRCLLRAGGRVACFDVAAVVPHFELSALREVEGIEGAVGLAGADGRGGCVVLRDGHVTCFGDLGPYLSEIGFGPFASPRQIDHLAGVARVVIAKTHICALHTDRTLSCWGDGTTGALGAAPDSLEERCVQAAKLLGLTVDDAGGQP